MRDSNLKNQTLLVKVICFTKLFIAVKRLSNCLIKVLCCKVKSEKEKGKKKKKKKVVDNVICSVQKLGQTSMHGF